MVRRTLLCGFVTASLLAQARAADPVCLDINGWQFQTLEQDVAIVEDAQRRWVKKTGKGEEQLTPYQLVVLYMFDERCVHFFLKPDYVGDDPPTYCYEKASDRLVRADE